MGRVSRAELIARRQKKQKAADTITPERLAQRLGIGRNQMYDALKAGRIPGAWRIGRRWIIGKANVERILREGVNA